METILDDDEITLRYNGFVSGEGRSAELRYEEDSIRSGPMLALRKAYEQIYNESLVPSLRDFNDASTIGHPSKERQLLIDARETCLIAIFGFDCLLNRQAGGYYAHFDLDEALKRMALEANYQLQTGTGTVDVQNHFQQIARFIREHPRETGVQPDQMLVWEHIIVPQGTPRLLHDRTLPVMMGKDMTAEDLRVGLQYLSGFSRAGHIIRRILDELLENTSAERIPVFEFLPYTCDKESEN